MRLLLTLLLAWIVLAAPLPSAAPALAQSEFSAQRGRASLCRNASYARAHPRTCRNVATTAKKPAPAQPKTAEPPARPDLTAAEQDAAIIPNIRDARFWADSEADFVRALPTGRGPWINLSTGGGDGAFGAGLLSGWSESGKRPQFALVTGVSTGALMAPFVFVGSSMDDRLKRAYTEYNAGDIFEDVKTPESLVDTWPLKRLIAKEVTPELLAAVAEGHRAGRRLFVTSTNLDAARGVVWNMGAIAARGDEAALKLFRDIMLASTAIPGLFPPVLIDVEANGKATKEMHADGGLVAQLYTAPESMLNTSTSYRLPATELYVVANTRLTPEFQMTERSLLGVLGHAISVGVQAALRVAIDRAYGAAKRSEIPFNLAYPALAATDQQARGVFDSEFMKGLFELGVARGKTGTPFVPDVSDALRPPAPAPAQAGK
jgi:patatin-like phospholipase